MVTARAGAAIPAVSWMPATAGGCLGLALVIAGALAGSGGPGIAGCRNLGGHGDRE
jgi:hypothetical protein